MSEIFIIIGTAFTANIVWSNFIEKWLDSRPRKSIFIEPKDDFCIRKEQEIKQDK